jgi:hypothetical protein
VYTTLGVILVLAYFYRAGLTSDFEIELEKKDAEYNQLMKDRARDAEKYFVDRKILVNTIEENLDSIALLKIEVKELKGFRR